MSSVITTDARIRREHFFRLVFPLEQQGFICIATINRNGDNDFRETFFRWPDETDLMFEYIDSNSMLQDVYFAPMLFEGRHRVKDAVIYTPGAWADLDTCEPEKLLVAPSITVESSPKRWQAYWLFEEGTEPPPAIAEDLSKRIAYYHSADGADKSGWDLTQLLRIPNTFNHKYKALNLPVVSVVNAGSKYTDIKDFAEYPETSISNALDLPMPSAEDFGTMDADSILEQYRTKLDHEVWSLYQLAPDHDWSKYLYKLQMILFEAGMTRAEAYLICLGAACNKYVRDGKSNDYTWKDVCRVYIQYEAAHKAIPSFDSASTQLLTQAELDSALADRTFIEEYVDWAKDLGDAAWQYHQAGAFVALSSIVSSYVQLPTSFGVMKPNLWFMILADTTLTRKTTAMDIAMDLLVEVDADVVLATDGSIEGLFTSLSMRPGRASIFLRDEFSGLLEAMSKKDYYAGMAETLTKLYDGKFQKKVLRKETIELRDPVLIFFAGGIKDRTFQLLTHEHVASGFFPRFILISAESDLSKLRPMGPPTDRSIGVREMLRARLATMRGHYSRAQEVTISGQKILTHPKWDAKLTEEAWLRYNKFEADLLAIGMRTQQPDLGTPLMDRLAKSGLKAAVLIAAQRSVGKDQLVVELRDLIKAFQYIDVWKHYNLEALNAIGRSSTEKQYEQVLRAIKKRPGVLRSELMQAYHLSARDTDSIFLTLEQRLQISRKRVGKAEQLFPITH